MKNKYDIIYYKEISRLQSVINFTQEEVMKNYVRNGLILLALAGALSLSAGCGGNGAGSSNASSGEKPVLKVATEANDPPYRYVSEKNQITGFEIDLVKAVAKEMGVSVEFKDMKFSQLLDSVSKKDVDLAIGTLTVNEKRKEKVDFSDVYAHRNAYTVVVPKKGNSIRSEKDLKGKTVAVKKSSTFETRAKEMGFGKAVPLDHYEDIYKAVADGKAEAGISDEQAANYYLLHGGSEKLTVVGTLPGGNNFAIAIAKDNGKLKDEVNKALKKIMENGTYDELTNKWFSYKAAEKK